MSWAAVATWKQQCSAGILALVDEETRVNVTIKRFFQLASGAALLVLSGCTPLGWNMETGMFEPPVEIEISPVNIRLVPSDPQRTDPITLGNGPEYDKVLTGGYWTKVFVGDYEADATFTIDSAEWSLRGGYTATYTYDVAGHVTCNNKNFTIFVTGRGSSGWVVLAPMADALRAAVTEAAMKANSIASSCELDEAPSDGTHSIKTIHDELLLLNDLLEKGIITEAEFQEQKRRILGAEESVESKY